MKKVIKKKVLKKKTVSGNNVEKILVENFVSLQNVMTNLSINFNELSNKISKLLELFEVSAQAMAKKEINFTKPMDEEKIMSKLDGLAEQNKVIARGLTLIHEKNTQVQPPKQMSIPMPGAPKKVIPPKKEEYQKSPFPTNL